LMPVRPDFTRIIGATYADTGVGWLARLPALLDACLTRWKLTLCRAGHARRQQRGGAEAGLLTIEQRGGCAAALLAARVHAVAR
jgi:hypothetical protein